MVRSGLVWSGLSNNKNNSNLINIVFYILINGTILVVVSGELNKYLFGIDKIPESETFSSAYPQQ